MSAKLKGIKVGDICTMRNAVWKVTYVHETKHRISMEFVSTKKEFEKAMADYEAGTRSQEELEAAGEVLDAIK